MSPHANSADNDVPPGKSAHIGEHEQKVSTKKSKVNPLLIALKTQTSASTRNSCSDESADDPVLMHFSRSAAWSVDGCEIEWHDSKCIGKGSISYVFKTTWKARTVAAKVLRLDKCSETDRLPEYSLDLADELTVVSKNLAHPNIIDFLGAGTTIVDDRVLPLILYEYVSGGSVEDLFVNKPSQTWKPERLISLSWCHQLLLALTFLHELDAPMAHRDVKPANLLVSRDLKTIKLADFSLAAPMYQFQYRVPPIAGSMRYMAPEVTLKEPYPLDKADVYSAAITCWCLLTGQRPYDSITNPASAMKLARQGLRPSAKESSGMAKLLTAAWDTRPYKRPTARRFCAAVEQQLAKEKGSWSRTMVRTVKALSGKAKKAFSGTEARVAASELQ